MTHSFLQTAILTCAHCRQDYPAEIWLIVDVKERPDLASQLINDSLHQIICPACGMADHLDMPFLIYQPEQELRLLFCVPDAIRNDTVQKITWLLLGFLAYHLGIAWQDKWLNTIITLPPSTIKQSLIMEKTPDHESWLQRVNHPFADQKSRTLFANVLNFFRMDSLKRKCQWLDTYPLLWTEPALSTLAFLHSLTDYTDTSGDEENKKLYIGQFKAYLNEFILPNLVPLTNTQFKIEEVPREIYALIIQAIVLNDSVYGQDDSYVYERSQLIKTLERLLKHPNLPGSIKPAVLENLASAHWCCSDIWKTIDYLNEVVQLNTIEHRDRIHYLKRLAKALLYDDDCWPGGPFRQEELIQCYQELAQLTPESHPDRITYLSQLAGIYWRVYDEFQNVAHLSKVIECYQEIIQLDLEDHPEIISFYFQLGNALIERYNESNEEDDLSSATECYQKALQRIPEGHTDYPFVLNNLGTCFSCRYERWGKLDDLCMAISMTESALRFCQVGSELHVSILSNLGIDLRKRYRRLGKPEDLSAALDCFGQLLGETEEKTLRYIMLLNTLGTAKLERFLLQDTLVDLSSAIDYYQQVLGLIREEDINASAVILNKLATALLLRHQRLGKIDDLSQAINCLREAVHLSPYTQEDRSMYLSQLGLAYMARYHQSGDQADITMAADCFEEGVRLTPETDPASMMFLINLGTAHAIRYRRDAGEID